MKKLIISALLIGLISAPVQAKNFYKNMNENLVNGSRPDLEKHYNFNRKVGAVVRYAPSEYQAVGLIGLTVVEFLGKEVLIDLPRDMITKPKQKHFDIQDAAANFKGLKDGMNGRNELEENEFRKTIQTVNYLTEAFIRDNTLKLSQQEEVIKELKARIELLEKR